MNWAAVTGMDIGSAAMTADSQVTAGGVAVNKNRASIGVEANDSHNTTTHTHKTYM